MFKWPKSILDNTPTLEYQLTAFRGTTRKRNDDDLIYKWHRGEVWW